MDITEREISEAKYRHHKNTHPIPRIPSDPDETIQGKTPITHRQSSDPSPSPNAATQDDKTYDSLSTLDSSLSRDTSNCQLIPLQQQLITRCPGSTRTSGEDRSIRSNQTVLPNSRRVAAAYPRPFDFAQDRPVDRLRIGLSVKVKPNQRERTFNVARPEPVGGSLSKVHMAFSRLIGFRHSAGKESYTDSGKIKISVRIERFKEDL